eukprot:ANDGO_04436.mRNA.1 hypothetical protein
MTGLRLSTSEAVGVHLGSQAGGIAGSMLLPLLLTDRSEPKEILALYTRLTLGHIIPHTILHSILLQNPSLRMMETIARRVAGSPSLVAWIGPAFPPSNAYWLMLMRKICSLYPKLHDQYDRRHKPLLASSLLPSSSPSSLRAASDSSEQSIQAPFMFPIASKL